MLPSFEIFNFRTFQHLAIPKIGSVNLIVGRNNAGKTMLLEALRLHRSEGSPAVIRELLADRDEYGRTPWTSRRVMKTTRLESLFHGRIARSETAIQMSPIEMQDKRLDIRAVKLRRASSDERTEGGNWIEVESDFAESVNSRDTSVVGLGIKYGQHKERIIGPESIPEFPFGTLVFTEREPASDGTAFVPASGLPSQIAAAWWDAVSLTDGEERIVECLGLIAPIQRLSFVESPSEGGRIAVARLKGELEPIPLRSLGDGMRKMFHFALAMEAAREKSILLIDEIENGIHYSVLKDLWKFLIQAAIRSGVQVFATTHSWDCVMGFQQALSELEPTDAMLLRLFKREDMVQAIALEKDEIGIAVRDGIEVR